MPTYKIFYTLCRIDDDGHTVDVDFDDKVDLPAIEMAQAETTPAKLLEAAEMWVGQLDDPPAGTYFVQARIERHEAKLSWLISDGLESDCVEI